jgi:hypothetical protein
MYNELKSSNIQLDIFKDHSEIESNDFKIYKKYESGILVCADKYREGSDIRYLDCIVFADFVKNKGVLPFIQCIGRVQRKSNINDRNQKTVGYVIDSYEIQNIDNKTTDIVNKLICYYYDFFSKTEIYGDKKTSENLLRQYKDILSKYKFVKVNITEHNGIENENMIIIKLNDELHIKIHTKINDINFNNVARDFNNRISEHIVKNTEITEMEEKQFYYNKFKLDNKNYKINSNKEYNEKIEIYNLIENPQEYFQEIWKGWYDYLDIDISMYPKTLTELKIKCNEYNIFTLKQYNSVALQYNLPTMIKELYDNDNIF